MTVALYDGMCVICNQTRRVVTALDWRQRVEWLDVHRWDEVAHRFPQVDYQTAMGQIHVVTPDERMYVGFFGTRQLLRELPLTYPVWLLLHLPGMTWLGQRVYRFIARHRYQINRLFGMPVCDDGSCKILG
jgi:predicted DCC family thiol-disulfide oxidoreductase YuxK